MKRRTWRPRNDLPHLHAPGATPHPLRVLDLRARTTHVGQPGVLEIHNKETKERETKMNELTEWTWNSARESGVLPKAWLDLSGANLSGANLTRANLRWTDLSGADLTGANLTEADLTRADLRGANLTRADLTLADLRGANLRWTDLSEADLREADLTEANLDFSAWPLWCGSLGVKCDARLSRQLAYHLCALDCDDPEYLQVREACLDFANKIHRDDVPRLKRKERTEQ